MSLSPEELQAELRKGAQPERTSLAWSRTLLVLAATFGIIGIHSYESGVWIAIPAVALTCSGTALVTGSIVAHARLRAIHHIIIEQRNVAAVLPTLLMSGVTVLVSVVALLAITNPSW